MRSLGTLALAIAAGFFGGTLADIGPGVVAGQVTPPPEPAWVTRYCADASKCPTPTDVMQGLHASRLFYDANWLPCPAPPGGEPGTDDTNCGPGYHVGHWLLLTEGGPAHAPAAIAHRRWFVQDNALYMARPALGVRGAVYAAANGFGFGMPPDAVAVQGPQFPAPAIADTDAWFAAMCAADPLCSSGGSPVTRVEFDALVVEVNALRTELDALSIDYSSHVHPFGFAITNADGSPFQINNLTGTKQ